MFVELAVKGERIVRCTLNCVKMSSLRQSDAVVFPCQGLSCSGAAGEGDTELAGQPCGKGLDEEWLVKIGVFLVPNVE